MKPYTKNKIKEEEIEYTVVTEAGNFGELGLLDEIERTTIAHNQLGEEGEENE